ncbi:hypothetical protein AB0I28_30965 [Phytomonospora sp. NPDC050363]|uniref:hypothetical protein n=1 Tax=Phytomonospora sp. NPDC050363 TaxID=3155642 RepID=UPI0033F317DE
MSEQGFVDSNRKRVLTYVLLAVVAVVLLVLGIVRYDHARDNAEARAKADQLILALEQTGLPTPDRDQIIGYLGNDGGAVCADPGSALSQGIANWAGGNGAAGPGMRPGPIAERAVKGEVLVLTIYCPEELPAFMNYVDGLDLADTA